MFFAEPLFDALPDVVFFVKDAQGRYLEVNQTLGPPASARRVGSPPVWESMIEIFFMAPD